MMKKFYCLFLTVIVMAGYTTTRVNGQAAILAILFGEKVANENFYISLKLGVNYSDLNGLDNSSPKLGFNWSLLGTIKLSEKIYVVPEFSILSFKGAKDIIYVSSGIDELDEIIDPPDESKMALGYIDVPIILRYKIADGFFIGTGPQVSFLTSSKNVYERTVQPEDELEYSQGSQLEWNQIDYGWAFELTYNLSNAREGKGMDVHVRYVYGFADIIENRPA